MLKFLNSFFTRMFTSPMKFNKYILLCFLFFAKYTIAQEGIKINISDSSDVSEFNILDSFIKDKKIFMIGEDHRYRSNNSMLEYKYLRFLHEKHDVNYLILEYGFSVGWMLEQFVMHNNQEIGKVLNDYSYEEYSDAYQFLARYIKRNDVKNFKIIGIDLERELPYAAKALSLMLPENTRPPDSIQVGIESINALAHYFDTKVQKERFYKNEFPNKLAIDYLLTIKQIMEDYYQKPELYKMYIGKFANDFETLMNTMNKSKTWWKENIDNFSAQEFVKREIFMQNSVEKIFEKDNNAKVFGQFGRCHVLNNFTKNECPFYNYYSLSARLHESDKFKNDVFTIGVFYPNEPNFSDNKLEAYKGINKFITKSPKNQLTLYPLKPSVSDTSELYKRFNAIIINNNNIPGRITNQSNNNDVSDPILTSISYRAILTEFNFANFNSYFNTRFKEQIYNHGIALTVSNFEFVYQVEFDFFTSFSNKVPSGAEIDFKGSRFKSRFGYNILNSGDWQITPSVAIGYDNKTMNINTTAADSIKYFFNDNFEEKYSLSKFVVDFGVNIGLTVSHVMFQAFINNQYVLGKNQWEYNQQFSNQAPTLPRRQLFYGLQIGISF